MDARRPGNLRTPGFARLLGLSLGLPLALLLGADSARAHHLLPHHTLQCSENFPCPEAIQPRVRFWVEVFRNWPKDTAIFHDPNRPERVYEVFRSGQGCHRSVHRALQRERERIKKSLGAVAAKMEANREITDPDERHLAALFPAQNPRQIRQAANNIRCQSGVRDSFEAGLKRYRNYRQMIDGVLKESGLPPEIRYLPFVESSYNPAAYSKAGAAGMWQIMPKTARVLGLELNATVDERRDPEAATRAAVRYLQRAGKTLSAVAREADPTITDPQINPFIITSYNYGVSGMKRAIRQVGPDFMEVLERYKSPRFQIAVKNFYASFLAAHHVALNAHRYFGVLPSGGGEGAYQTVVLEHPASMSRIAAVFGLGEAELRPLNRALTRFVWRGWRLIPAGYRLHLPPRDDHWAAARAKLASLGPERVISGGDRYTVRRGDTACGIARAVRVNCSELIRANHLGKTALIIPGQKLLIPRKIVVATTTTTATTIADNHEAPPQPTIATTYRVRRGDTACGIAQRFAVGCRTLLSHNRLGHTAIIRPGQKLAIPGVAAASLRAGDLNADNHYIVRKGDSACGIAQRFAVGCRTLISHNRLGRTAVIHPGQKLTIPGEAAASLRAGGLNADNQYIVRRGDSACRVAQRFAVNCNRLRRLNRLNAEGIIHPGQKLKIPGLVVPETSRTAELLARVDGVTGVASGESPRAAQTEQAAQTEAAEAVAKTETAAEAASAKTANAREAGGADTLRNLLDTLPDLGVGVADDAGKPVYTVRVEADETLGHFADWLGIGGSRHLRELNDLSSNRDLAIGARLVLPIRDAQTVERFEQRRTDYHQILSESLKEYYDLVGIESYSVRRGDSPWTLSQQLGFPVWLLYRLNPVLRNALLTPGQVLLLPKLKAKI